MNSVVEIVRSSLEFIGDFQFPEIYVVAGVVLVFLWPCWRIFKKAGYPGWLSLLLLIPFVNIAIIWFLAFASWPALGRRRKRGK